RGMVSLKVYRPSDPERGVIRAGTECDVGQVLAEEGDVVTAALVGQLALAGFATVPARPRPRVITLGIGDELADVGSVSTPGRVVDAASYVLTAAARQSHAQAFRLDTVGSDSQRLKGTLDDNAMRADVLVLTGLRLVDVLSPVFGEVKFRELPVSPGGTVGFGRIGGEQTPVICLPGDAGSAYVGFELLVRPVLRRLAGAEPVFRHSVRASLTESVNSQSGVREFRPAILRARRGGGYTVSPQPGGRHLIRGLAKSNGLMVLGDHTTLASAGTPVDVLQLDR
ncbi:MAG: molybdopterin-binding protein, partial [Pseudonocardiaceae bacterium]